MEIVEDMNQTIKAITITLQAIVVDMGTLMNNPNRKQVIWEILLKILVVWEVVQAVHSQILYHTLEEISHYQKQMLFNPMAMIKIQGDILVAIINHLPQLLEIQSCQLVINGDSQLINGDFNRLKLKKCQLRINKNLKLRKLRRILEVAQIQANHPHLLHQKTKRSSQRNKNNRVFRKNKKFNNKQRNNIKQKHK